ncbi:RIP metalloprotease RseP [Flavobacterium psychrotrophum]|uniref:RIP metalloprotease RseP n=1 Tax=Flavobacterium psychrotrophum TaxID=2294119 RepID=UPI000E30D195|nr:RIP metalloprotease RseP [Flavobacterium psychrotrophum]
MDTLIQIAQLVLMLSILVILHEFGHYITAKMFKVRVEKFYLFMDAGFSLIKKKIGETEWGIGWLPLGGYVKLSGMIDESMDTEAMKTEPQPWEFRSKPAWQRLIIMLGGIIVNILLAWFIFTFVYTYYGKEYMSTAVIQEKGLAFGSVGKASGFEDGDKILKVDGKYQPRFDRMVLDVLLGDHIQVERAGKVVDIKLTDENLHDILEKEGRDFIHPLVSATVIDSLNPKGQAIQAGLKTGDSLVGVEGKPLKYMAQVGEEAFKHKKGTLQLNIKRGNTPMTITTAVDSTGTIGIVQKAPRAKDYYVRQEYSFFSAIPAAMEESYTQLVYTIKQFKLILRPSTGAYTQVTSVVGIASKLPTTWDWEYFWKFTAFFSVGLAFMNLLPIPGLDGGHAIFTIAEMLTGKKLSDKAAGVVQTVGMVILLSLMALVMGKDIWILIRDKFF